MSDTKQFEFGSLKELAVFVPVLGTAIAITYDVGFFWGLDINYFTLFSLTEHLVFALEALPIALSLSFVSTALFVTFKVADQRDNEKIAREMLSLTAQEQLEWLREEMARRRRSALMWAGISLAWTIAASFISALLSLIVLVVCVALYTVGLVFYTNILRSPFMVATYGVVVSLLTTFAVGIDVQERFVRRGKVAHTVSLEDSELKGRIVRAGDRGILFYEPGSQEITFVRWEAVKRIRTVL
jgi:hypothetical protein